MKNRVIVIILIVIALWGCKSTRQESQEAKFLTIEEVKILLQEGKVKELHQPHTGHVNLMLYDGTRLAFNQPKLDWIFHYINDHDLMHKIERTTME